MLGPIFAKFNFFKRLERRGVDLVIKNKKKKGEGQVVGRSSNIFFKRKERARWTHFVNAADPLEIKLWLQLVQNISKVDF